MSFFRNLRSSITRGRSSSRDTTPVPHSRTGSVISSLNSSSSSGKRRDSVESRSDSLLNRSDTFILEQPDVTPCHSNCSTLEKKSKKSKVLEKFSTFTKRKKKPALENEVSFEHHPSDNATNTYYKYQADGGGNSLDYDSQNDPFNFLYEQQSSMKAKQNPGGDSLKSHSSSPASSFDSSTFRKSKVPSDLKNQLKLLKDQDFSKRENNIKAKVQEIENEEEEDEEEEKLSPVEPSNDFKPDKYKTVTLNSFRRSFREKFLQQQKDAAHNPAWFVEVETPEINKNQNETRDCSKENRRDLLVFENENYRPGSRSPIRDRSSRKELRTSLRSPVKRNETFKVERLSRLDQPNRKAKPQENVPSIRIEFKNSIMPHMPGRMVPVGVAKPMPSQLNYNNYYRKMEPSSPHTNYANKTYAGITSTRLNPNPSPARSPYRKTQSPARNTNTTTNVFATTNSNPTRLARYQTLVQIKNEKSQQQQQQPTVSVRNSRLSTRVQFTGSNLSPHPNKKTNTSLSPSPAFVKRYNSAQLLSSSGSKAQPLRQTYFGDAPQTARISQIPSSLSSSTSGLRMRQPSAVAVNNGGGYGGGFKYHTPSLFASASSLTTTTKTPVSVSATNLSYSTPSHSVSNIYSNSNTSSNTSSNNNNNHNISYLKQHHQQQRLIQPQQHKQQTSYLTAAQRRSRSPIKAPWR